VASSTTPSSDGPANTVESWGDDWYTRPSRPTSRPLDRSEGMWWPAGKRVVPSSRLKQLLARSARWHARTAIAGFVSDDLDALLQAAFSCGSAVELISKAYLASLSHSFLTDKGERDSLFMFAGHGALANTSATQVRSIGALDVARVLKHLHRESPLDLQDPVALRVRNSAAHMALVDAGELRLGVIQMVKVVEMILPLLDLEPEAFWGDHAVPVVSALLDQARTEIARVVQAKISAAKERLALLTKSLAADQVVILLATLSGRATSPSEHNEQQVCPVCGQQGWLLCNIERGEV